MQIDVPETLGIGTGPAFYESTGAFRDMVVTHLLQVLAFVAMEPPTALTPQAINEEKNKVFCSMRPLDPNYVVRGQYGGYRGLDGVAADSDTETFVALRCEIDNWRWAGVPFFLRTGKRLAEGARIISIAFREPPKSMFPRNPASAPKARTTSRSTLPSPPSSRSPSTASGPGRGCRSTSSACSSRCTRPNKPNVLEAYERLLHDAMSGDHTLFSNAEGIERLWEVSHPLLNHPPEVQLYRVGSWGPPGIIDLISPRGWRLPFEREWRDHK